MARSKEKNIEHSEFMIGNKNAEKRTEEKVEKFWVDSLTLLKGDETIVFIGELAIRMNTYRDVFEYLADRFKGLSHYKREIERIIEVRVHKGAITGGLKETTSIFTLKNNHGRKDKTEQDINSKVEVSPVQIMLPNNERG